VLTDKLLDFDALEQADAPKGDDSFRQDTLSFNSGNNSSLTLFIMYTANTIHVQNPEFESSGNIGNSDLRIDDIEMTFLGAPQDGVEAFVDEFRLVSHPGNSN
jgi:poly(beta-D-mannuronate) lyase